MSAMKDFGDPKYVDVWADDVVTLSLQYSTRWDSLAHVGAESDADGVEVEPGDKDHEPHRHSFLPIHHLRLFRLGCRWASCGTSTSWPVGCASTAARGSC